MDKNNQNLPSFSLPNMEEAKVELEQAEYIVKMETEHAEELDTAREHFEKFEIETREEADIEGDERLGFYMKKSNGTSIQDLMAMCDADLPYVDEKVREDYLTYKELFKIDYRRVDFSDRRSQIRKLRGK